MWEGRGRWEMGRKHRAGGQGGVGGGCLLPASKSAMVLSKSHSKSLEEVCMAAVSAAALATALSGAALIKGTFLWMATADLGLLYALTDTPCALNHL